MKPLLQYIFFFNITPARDRLTFECQSTFPQGEMLDEALTQIFQNTNLQINLQYYHRVICINKSPYKYPNKCQGISPSSHLL